MRGENRRSFRLLLLCDLALYHMVRRRLLEELVDGLPNPSSDKSPKISLAAVPDIIDVPRLRSPNRFLCNERRSSHVEKLAMDRPIF